MSQERELQVVVDLQRLLEEVYPVAPAPVSSLRPSRVTAASSGPQPSIQDVLAGLGYLVALQNSPGVGEALPGGLGRSLLENLLAVIRDWLVRHSPEEQKNDSVAGFYRRASEHVNRFRSGARAEGSEP